MAMMAQIRSIDGLTRMFDLSLYDFYSHLDDQSTSAIKYRYPRVINIDVEHPQFVDHFHCFCLNKVRLLAYVRVCLKL